MATRPLTDHEYRINGGSWTGCTLLNSIDNEDGTYTINQGLDSDIPIGGLEVRVKSIDINPPSPVLINTEAFDNSLGFLFSRGITIDNTNTGITLDEHQFKIELNSSNFSFYNTKSDGSDIRIFDGSDGLPMYIESYSKIDEEAIVWTKVSIPLNSNKMFKIRYGKPDAVSISDYSSVFNKKTIDETTRAIYNLDEGSGNIITDEHGDFPGIAKGHTWVDDLDFPEGYAISLSGVNSSIRVPNLLASFGAQGCIAMSFKANSYSGRLFTKFIGEGKLINLFINGDVLVFQTVNGSLSNQIFSNPFSLGVKYRVAVNWDNINFYFYMDSIIVGVCKRFHIDGDYTPLTFGAYVETPGEDNEQACLDGIIDNIVVYKKMLTENEVKADFEFRKNIPLNQSDKITTEQPIPWLLGELSGFESSVWENTILQDDDEIKVYYTGASYVLGSLDTYICLATTPNMETPLTRHGSPLIGLGYGGADINTKANCSQAFKYGGFYYVVATNGYSINIPEAGVYMYKSSDGINFTNLGKILDNSFYEGLTDFGNLWIIPELINGKFKFYFEGVLGSYQIMLADSTNIEGPYEFVSELPSLKTGLSYNGGVCVRYINEKYYCYMHGHSSPGVNAYLIFSVSNDGINWTISAPSPAVGVIEARTIATDQNADPCITEIGGKVYLAAEFVDNTNPEKSDIYLWKFNGTMDNFVKDGIDYEIGNEV